LVEEPVNISSSSLICNGVVLTDAVMGVEYN